MAKGQGLTWEVPPTYRDNSVQASVGWPLVELTLYTGNAPMILTGSFRPETDGDNAWCQVVEFGEEFGISVGYDPLVLVERRDG